MRRIVAVAVIGAMLMVTSALFHPAEAGDRHRGSHRSGHRGGISTGAGVALGVLGGAILLGALSPVVFARPRVVHDPYPVYYSSPPPVPAVRPPQVVYYPHGRYELYGDGVTVAYQWVWIPNQPPPVSLMPPPPPSGPPS